jgi:hypothetical protein
MRARKLCERCSHFSIAVVCALSVAVVLGGFVVAVFTKAVVHVVDKDDVTTVGTRFAFTKPVAGLTTVESITKCHGVVVREGSSESDSTASFRFGFNEEYFRAHGFRLCTQFELVTISVVTTLPDGKYPTYSSADGDDITRFTVTGGRLESFSEDSATGTNAYTVADTIAVCCVAGQFAHVGEGDGK